MSELVASILRVQKVLQMNKATDESHEMIMRFARFLPSPSKLNAGSVIQSNSAEKLAKWLEAEEAAN